MREMTPKAMSRPTWIVARLDRLSAVKEVAQTAAVIGREFSHARGGPAGAALDWGYLLK